MDYGPQIWFFKHRRASVDYVTKSQYIYGYLNTRFNLSLQQTSNAYSHSVLFVYFLVSPPDSLVLCFIIKDCGITLNSSMLQCNPWFLSFSVCLLGLGRQNLWARQRLPGGTLSHWAWGLPGYTQHVSVPFGQIHQGESDNTKICFLNLW